MEKVVVYQSIKVNGEWVVVEQKTFDDFVAYCEDTLDRVVWAKIRGINVTESGYDNQNGYDKTFVIDGEHKIHAFIIK